MSSTYPAHFIQLRDAIYNKWGQCFDVNFQPVTTFGFRELYLNVMPFRLGSKRFRHETELDYLCHLQAIVSAHRVGLLLLWLPCSFTNSWFQIGRDFRKIWPIGLCACTIEGNQEETKSRHKSFGGCAFSIGSYWRWAQQDHEQHVNNNEFNDTIDGSSTQQKTYFIAMVLKY